MNRKEVTDLLEKIQAHRQTFLITNVVINEWTRILEDYDYKDVDKKIDEFFQNGDNFGKYPDAYYLTKYLKKHDEKLKSGIIYVRCQNCGLIVEFVKYDEHIDKCNSIDYLCLMAEKYFNKKLNKEKMLVATKQDFDNYYWNFCEKLLDTVDDKLQKHCLENAILIHQNKQPKYGLEELIGRI